MRRRTLLIGALPLAASASLSSGAVITGFNLTSVPNTAQTTVAATTVDPSVSASSLSRGSGLTAAALTHAFSSTGFSPTSTSTAGAAAANDYYQVSLTVQPGETLSLTTISDDLRRSSAAAPSSFEFDYSFDGFVSDSELAGTFTDTLTSSTNGNGESEPPIDLSVDADLQNIAAGTTVTFRLYGYGATATSATLAVGRLASVTNPTVANDLEFDGTATAVPEPASIMGLSIFAGSSLLRRRRS